MRLDRQYEAEAAHQLSAGVPVGHQCRRLHGHRYEITVTILGDLNPETGMLLEYADIDTRVWRVLRFVDHRFINMLGMDAHINTDPPIAYAGVLCVQSIDGEPIIEQELAEKVRRNSTVENLQAWFEAELKHHFPRENLRVGPTAFLSPQVYAVSIKEDSRSGVA